MHKEEISELILLDTHIWLWLMTGSSKAISPKLSGLINRLKETTSIRVSAISAWEVGMLVLKNRISFEAGFKKWIYDASNAPGIGIEPITIEIAMESTLLEDCHADPADRILIATAKHIGATLITHDKEILSYAKKHRFPAMSL